MAEGTWEKLSQVAVPEAEYDSPERQPHPKCLKGTRVNLLEFIHGLLDKREKSQMIWLHGTAGVGKSAVAFTVAEMMKSLEVREDTKIETRLAGTFFFSRKHTKCSTTGHFFATLACQLASNFPSAKNHVNEAIRENPAVLDSSKSLRDQMKALFRQPLRHLQSRLRECLPPVFVIDALDECKPETVADLISLLGEALRDPDLPVFHILLTSRLEAHIRQAIQKKEMGPLVYEIPVNTSGEGVAGTISLDGEDVDNDIYIFLQHSFTELRSSRPDFPQPSADKLTRLANRAGRRFIVASTMMKFVDDGYNDPRDRLKLMLELTNDLLPGTEVHKLYDCILATCSDPGRAYQHLSIVTALADPLPISQISELLGPGQGSDVATALVQLRSFMDIPADRSQPVNIYHSSIRDYASDLSNCSLQLQPIILAPHSLLAYSSFRLMIEDIPEHTTLMDALLELKSQNHAMEAHDPKSLQQSLAFIVEPPAPLHILTSMLWLRGARGSGLRSWLETLDGRAWLQTQGGEDYLQTQKGEDWLQTRGGGHWLQTYGGETWLQTERGREWLQSGPGWQWTHMRRRVAEDPGEQIPFESLNWRDSLETISGQGWLETSSGREWLLTQTGGEWLLNQTGGEWLQSRRGEEWLQTSTGKAWLQQTSTGRGWLQTQKGREWLQIEGREERLMTPKRRKLLQAQGWREWLQTPGGREWVTTLHGQYWLGTEGGRKWLGTEGGQEWLGTEDGKDWLRPQSRKELLHTPSRRGVQTLHGREWLGAEGGRKWLGIGWLVIGWLVIGWLVIGWQGIGWLGIGWLGTKGRRKWLSTKWLCTKWLCIDWLGRRKWLGTDSGRKWLGTENGRKWLGTKNGRKWLGAEDGPEWLGAENGPEGGQNWLCIEGGRKWLDTEGGRKWLGTKDGQNWLDIMGGREWLGTEGGGEWLGTKCGREWLGTKGGQDWLDFGGRLHWLKTQMGREWLQTSIGQDWLQTPKGQDWLHSQSEHGWLQLLDVLQTSMHASLHHQHGQDWLRTWYGREWLLTPSGREWLLTQSGEEWLSTPEGRKWLHTPGGQEWLQTPGGLQTKSGREWLQAKSGEEWLLTPSGRQWLQTKGRREWLQTQRGQEWLQTSHGQAWQLTPAASVWMAMEDFSKMLETISECTFIPQLPAFQAIREFESLPDFLMFPAFLALRPQDHSTSASLQDCPDIEVIHAMTAFMIFAIAAQERSQSTSDALKYACQNWAVHLSRAQTPRTRNDALEHIFKLFWNRYSLAWLERQWCLKGLRSCLVVLSEGQKIAKVR
jgi:hypothetical protein